MTNIIPTIITAVITFIAGLLVNKQGRNQFFSTVVSKERMEWIKEMRVLCTDLCTICETYEHESELPSNERATFLKAKNGMILHLNNTEKKDQQDQFPIDKQLYDMLKDKSFEEIRENVPSIRDKATIIFKTEWDKVKIEAGNSPAKIRQIQELQDKINKQ